MVIAIGTDLVHVPRIARAMARHGTRLARRILSDTELKTLESLKHNREVFLASRFAAREAAAKALGTGIAEGVSWRDFEVYSDAKGAPKLRFLSTAYAVAQRIGAKHAHLSLSDDGDYVLAFVVLTGIAS